MVFQAVVKQIRNGQHERVLISAPDGDAIDEWWRAVSEKQPSNWKRLAPDFYWTDGGFAGTAAPEFTDRFIFTYLDYPEIGRTKPIFPHRDRIDHVSGGCFYIRSKSNPKLYWLLDGNLIRATKEGRTRFRIAIVDEDEPKIMIGSDRISISPATDPAKSVIVEAKGQLYVGIGDSNNMTFSYLKQNLLAESQLEGFRHDYVSWVKKVDDGMGEEWELVK